MLAAISAACAGQIGAYAAACSHSIEAGTKQVGLYQTIVATQNFVQDRATLVAKQHSPELLVKAAPFIAMGYQIGAGREVSWSFKSSIICDQVAVRGSKQGSGAMVLQWSLP